MSPIFKNIFPLCHSTSSYSLCGFPRHLKFLKEMFILASLTFYPPVFWIHFNQAFIHSSSNSSHQSHQWHPRWQTQQLVLCLPPSSSIWHIGLSFLPWNALFAFHKSTFWGFPLWATAFHCPQLLLLVSPHLPDLQFWGHSSTDLFAFPTILIP